MAAHLAPVLAAAEGEQRAVIADIVAVLEVGGRLFLTPRSESAREKRAEWVSRSPCRLYDELLALREGHPRTHDLSSDVLRETRRIANQLRGMVGVDEPVEHDRTPLPAPDALAPVILSAWPASAFVERARVSARERRRYRSVAWTNGDVEISVDTADVERRGREPIAYHEAALVLDHRWVQAQGVSVRGFARTVLPVSIASFRRAGVGDASYSEPILDANPDGTPRLSAIVEQRIGRVSLDGERVELEGDALHEAAAEFVLENRLLKGVARELRQRLHLLGIIADWPEPLEHRRDGIETPEARAWLVERFATLGVQESADLALVEPDDVLPDLVELTGLPTWDIEAFAEDFPRRWIHLGAEYAVDVRARSRKITLSPRNRAAKDASDPDRRVLPSFRSFSVFFHKASRRVRLR